MAELNLETEKTRLFGKQWVFHRETQHFSWPLKVDFLYHAFEKMASLIFFCIVKVTLDF